MYIKPQPRGSMNYSDLIYSINLFKEQNLSLQELLENFRTYRKDLQEVQSRLDEVKKIIKILDLQ